MGSSAGYDVGNYFSTFGATSAACPQVSGAAALILSVAPNLSYDDVANVLTRNATKHPGQAYHDNQYGYGRLNIGAALHELLGDIKGLECLPSGTQVHKFDRGTRGAYTQNYPVTWSATGALSIDNTGLATVIGTGYAKITMTLTTPNGDLAIDKEVWVAGGSLKGVEIQSSSSAICYNSGNIFSLTNVPNSASVTWSASNPTLVSISTYQAQYNTYSTSIRAANTNSSGWVTITASISVCGAVAETRNFDIWVGDLSTYPSRGVSLIINNPTLFGDLICRRSTTYASLQFAAPTPGNPDTFEYEWYLEANASQTLLSTGIGESEIKFMTPALPKNTQQMPFTISVRVRNACGDWSSYSRRLYVRNTINGQQCITEIGGKVINPTLTAFPNPTNSILNLKFDNIDTNITSICIMNSLGIKVLCEENAELSADKQTNLNLSNLPEGIYVLQIVYENGFAESKKIVLQKGVIAN